MTGFNVHRSLQTAGSFALVTLPARCHVQRCLVTFQQSTVGTLARVGLTVGLIGGCHGTFATFDISSVNPLQRNAVIRGQLAVAGAGFGVTGQRGTTADALLPSGWEFGIVATGVGAGLARFTRARFHGLFRQDATAFRNVADNPRITLRRRHIDRRRRTLGSGDRRRITRTLLIRYRRTRDTGVISPTLLVTVIRGTCFTLRSGTGRSGQIRQTSTTR